MAMYIGGGGGTGASGAFPISGPYGTGGPPGGTPQGSPKLTMPFRGGPFKPPRGGGAYSGAPAQLTVPNAPSNILPAQAVRPTGASQGYDPAYLQNLATAIGGLFSRPKGNLAFNPLGNLSDIGGPGLGTGNAPLPGLPSTMLQDALNGLAFLFNPPAAPSTGGGGSTVGGGGTAPGRNRGGRPIYPE